MAENTTIRTARVVKILAKQGQWGPYHVMLLRHDDDSGEETWVTFFKMPEIPLGVREGHRISYHYVQNGKYHNGVGLPHPETETVNSPAKAPPAATFARPAGSPPEPVGPDAPMVATKVPRAALHTLTWEELGDLYDNVTQHAPDANPAYVGQISNMIVARQQYAVMRAMGRGMIDLEAEIKALNTAVNTMCGYLAVIAKHLGGESTDA